MRGNWLYGLVAIVIIAALGAGVLGLAYNAGISQGLAQGIAQGGDAPGTAQGAGPYYYRYGGPFFGPFGFGFGFILFPLLFFLLFAFIARALFWRGPRPGHPHNGEGRGYWGGTPPPQFEEWHRKAHESGGTQA